MISILDTTYREGKQSYLGHLLPNSMIDYAKLLEKVGVRYMEVGYPFTSDIYLHEFRRLLKAKPKIQIGVHSALNKDNFKKLIEEGVTTIDTSLKLNELTEEIIDSQILEITQAINHCSTTYSVASTFRIGIENAFKLPTESLLMLCKRVADIKGVTRVSLSDTDGSATPKMVKTLLEMLDTALPKNKALELHLHNDCGLAGTNLYEAYILFKDSDRELVIDATLGGIGERNGITSIGDILSLLYLTDKSLLKRCYSTKHYAKLYQYVFKDQVFNRDPLNPASFAHSSGLHIAKFLEAGTYQSIDPNLFGQETKLVFNGSINSDAIRVFSKMRLGIDIDKETASRCALMIRNLSTEKKRSFTNGDIVPILKDLLNYSSST